MTYGAYRSGGYIIIRATERQHWMSAELLPEHLLSASICICPRVPDTWALRWVQTSEEERRNEAQLVGISAEKLDAVSDWATEAFAVGRVGWPFVFLRVADARAFAHAFLPRAQHAASVSLLGLGLHRRYVARLLEEGRPGGPAAQACIGSHARTDAPSPGVYTAIRESEPLAGGGQPLGFELLAYDGLGGFESWLCGHLETDINDQLGIRPNENGFLPTLRQAQSSLEYVSRPDVGKEPGVWLPWLMVRYSLD